MNRYLRIFLHGVKTAAAVALSAGAMVLIGEKPFFACIGAFCSVGETRKASFEGAMIQIGGTALGCLVGSMMATLTNNIYAEALGVIPIICATDLIKKYRRPVAIPAVIGYFAVVYLTGPYPAYLYGVIRLLETSIGILIAFAINELFVLPSADADEKEACLAS